MNITCLEFHRRLTVDPSDRDPALAHHSTVCPPCAAFAQRIGRLSRSLRAAIDIEPPRELCARILLRQSCAARKAAHARRGWWLALAASILVVLGLVGGLGIVERGDSLQRAVLAHVESEPLALDTHTILDVARVNTVAQKLNTRVDDSLGSISFASICDVGDSKGVHLVTHGNKGPITVLVMPDRSVNARVAIHDDRYDGVIVPRAGGSIAIVGRRGESLEAIEARIDTSVHVL